MTTGLSIARVHAHVRCAEAEEGQRVASWHAQVVHDAAVAPRPVPSGHALTFIRSIDVMVRLDRGLSDGSGRDRWTAELRRAIEVAVSERSACVVRYETVEHLLVDVAEALGSPPLPTRAWAWALSEVTPGATTYDELARGVVAWLESRPTAIVPLLRLLARRGTLVEFVIALGEAALDVLAASAANDPVITSAAPRPLRWPARDLRGEPIVVAARCFDVDRPDRRIWATLVARVLQPGGPLTGEAVAAALAELTRPEPRPGTGRPTPGAPLAAHATPATALAGASLGTGELHVAAQPARDPLVRGEGRYAPRRPAAGTARGAVPPAEAEPRAEPSEAVATGPDQWFTRCGGLLYLLNLLTEPALFDILVPALPGRTTTWVLQRIGDRITGSSDDPAGAVFAGLHPADSPEPVSPMSYDEAAAITRAVEAFADATAVRIRAAGPSARALDRVVRRRARLLMLGPWCDAHFALDDVDIDIRLAGLDRDPGFVAISGTIVRFHYV